MVAANTLASPAAVVNPVAQEHVDSPEGTQLCVFRQQPGSRSKTPGNPHLPAACIEELNAHHRLPQGLLLVAAEARGLKHLHCYAPAHACEQGRSNASRQAEADRHVEQTGRQSCCGVRSPSWCTTINYEVMLQCCCSVCLAACIWLVKG